MTFVAVAVIVGLAGWETLGVVSRRVPTISSTIRSLPWPARVGVVAAMVVAAVDHFLTGVVL